MPNPSPTPQTTTTTSNTAPWGKQQGYLAGQVAAKNKPAITGVFPEAERLYKEGAYSFFPGQTYAPTDTATTAGLNAQEATANEILSGNINPNSGVGRFISNSLAGVVPGIDARFASAGREGSGLHGRALGEGVAGALSPLYMAAPGMLSQVGAQREQYAQRPIDEAMARHDFGQTAQDEALRRYASFVTGNYGGSTTGTSTQYIQQQNPWMQALGFGLSAAGAAGGLGWRPFSDRRLKKDIKKVGKTDDGLGVYTYKYKWEGPELPKHMGVMAQEVEKKKPEAVGLASLMGKTYRTVDMGAI